MCEFGVKSPQLVKQLIVLLLQTSFSSREVEAAALSYSVIILVSILHPSAFD
jgi:hypothetical protein